MIEKKKLEVGVKYRGYGTLNEFGEFEFTPEDTGAKAGSVKQVTSGQGYSVSTSKQYVLVHLKVKRNQEKMDRMRDLLSITNILINIFRKYAF